MTSLLWVSKFLRPKKIEKIRIGNDNDGGYVLPKKCIDLAEICISYGLGTNTTFEEDLIRRGIKVLGFDCDLQIQAPWAKQYKLKTYQDFSELPEAKNNKNIILKIDTEGAEWGFFKTLDIEHFSNHVSCFAFELHFTMNHENLPLSVMEKMFESHHVVHVHGNNYGYNNYPVPECLEITLANNNILDNWVIDTEKYPTNLDSRNDASKPDLHLSWIHDWKLYF